MGAGGFFTGGGGVLLDIRRATRLKEERAKRRKTGVHLPEATPAGLFRDGKGDNPRSRPVSGKGANRETKLQKPTAAATPTADKNSSKKRSKDDKTEP